MSLVEAGSLVGGVIGSPVSLDMKKVDSATHPADSKPVMGGGAGGFGASSAKPSEPPKPFQAGRGFNNSSSSGGGGGFKPGPPASGGYNSGGGGASGSGFYSGTSQGSWGAKSANTYNNGGATNRPVQSAISPNRDPHPISSLNPYQSKWTIRVRAVAKPQVRSYSNSRGEGRLMSVEFVDKSGEIRATAFNEEADKFAPIIEANKVYFVSRGRIKPANKQYSSVKNDYELFFQSDTIVEEDTSSSTTDLPGIQFNFTPIDQLAGMPKDTIVDVIGVCKSANDVSSVTTRTTNRKLLKRDIELVDMTGTAVSLTLWGTEAETFDGSSNPVLAIKGARLSDFGGCSMSLLNSSTLQINPDIPEAFKLRGWFDNDGKMASTVSISGQRSSGGAQNTWLSLSQIRDLNLGHGDKPDYFSTKGFISFFKKDNCLYQACPKPDCNKKVTGGNMGFHCEKCNQTTDNYKWRLMLQVCIADWSGNLWFTCFQDQAEAILKRTAAEIGTIKDEPQQAAEFDQIFSDATFGEFSFRMRAKMEMYNDEQRLKVTCVEASPLDHAQHTKRLIQEVKDMLSR